jgi:hypothetical protein
MGKKEDMQVHLEAHRAIIKDISPGILGEDQKPVVEGDDWVTIDGITLKPGQWIWLMAGYKPGIDQVQLDLVVTPDYVVAESTWVDGHISVEKIDHPSQHSWMGMTFEVIKALEEQG